MISFLRPPCVIEETLDNIHIALKSLIKTSATLREEIHTFVIRHVGYDDGAERDWTQYEEFWHALQVDPLMVEQLKLLRPRWDSDTKTLFINGALREDKTHLKSVTGLLFWASSWVNFSDTRFGKVGSCGRRWLISQAMGYGEIYEIIYANPKISKYHSSGYRRMQQPERLLLTTASFSTYPVESFILEMLEDDRFYLRADSLWSDILAESQFVCNISDAVWDLIVDTGGITIDGSTFREYVVEAMHVSIGFVYQEAFWELGKPPVALTQGNLTANVARLSEQVDEPTDRVSRQLWHCLRMGVSPSHVEQVLTLWREVPCSSGLVEKGHGMGATQSRFHPMLNMESLTGRQLLRDSCTLLARKKEDIHKEALVAKLDELINSNKIKRTCIVRS